MPSINIDKLKELKDDFKNYSYFVETGTYLGDTTFAIHNLFNKYFTIEVSETLYNNFKAKLSKENHSNIISILGDSSHIFNSLLPSLNENTIFFLDGHYSAGFTGKGDKEVPLIEEITLINSLFTKRGIIMIDDYRLFENNQDENWRVITKDSIVSILSSRLTSVYHLSSNLHPQDILVLHIEGVN